MSTTTTQKPVAPHGDQVRRHDPDRDDRERLVEHVADWRTREVTVDAAAGVIANVALAGLVSKNGYRYAEQTLREAAPLYEGKPVFLDHAADPAKPQQRSTRDLAGTVVRPRFEDDRLRADIATNSTDAGRTLLALAEKEQPGVGMSHVVLAERNGDGTIVERIHEVVSVDAVVFPATTSTFHEQAEPSDPILAASCQTQEAHTPSRGDTGDVLPGGPDRSAGQAGRCLPACLALEERDGAGEDDQAAERGVNESGNSSVALLAEGGGDGADASLEVLIAEVRRLSTAVDALTPAGEVAGTGGDGVSGAPGQWPTAQHRELVDRLVCEAALPAGAVSTHFVQTLLECKDEVSVRGHLEDRWALVRRLGCPVPRSRERDGDVDWQSEDRRAEQAMIEAVRDRPTGVLGVL